MEIDTTAARYLNAPQLRDQWDECMHELRANRESLHPAMKVRLRARVIAIESEMKRRNIKVPKRESLRDIV